MRRAGYTSRAAPGIQSRLRRVREMKRARTFATRALRFAVLRSVAVLGVVLLAIDAARLLVRFVLQMSTFARGHDAIGLGACFDAIQVHLAGGEAARLGHASARRSPRRCGCAARWLCSRASIARRAGRSGARHRHREGQTDAGQKGRLLHVLSCSRPEIGALATNNGPAAVALTRRASYYSRLLAP